MATRRLSISHKVHSIMFVHSRSLTGGCLTVMIGASCQSVITDLCQNRMLSLQQTLVDSNGFSLRRISINICLLTYIDFKRVVIGRAQLIHNTKLKSVSDTYGRRTCTVCYCTLLIMGRILMRSTGRDAILLRITRQCAGYNLGGGLCQTLMIRTKITC